MISLRACLTVYQRPHLVLDPMTALVGTGTGVVTEVMVAVPLSFAVPLRYPPGGLPKKNRRQYGALVVIAIS